MRISIDQMLLRVVLVLVVRSMIVETFTREVLVRRRQSLSSLNQVYPNQRVARAFVPKIYSREDAQLFIDEILIPQQDYGERKVLGLHAHGVDESSGPLHANDPRLSMTYAEFPLKSMDELVDACLKFLPHKQKADKISLVDLGSGCGRLVLYSAMTRGSAGCDQSWDIHGIEISDLLHKKALEYVNKGIHTGVLSSESVSCSTHGVSVNTLSLNLGPAEHYTSLLQHADIIFTYSTAFPAKHFSPDLGALVLDPEWSDLLSRACSAGCVAVTTDRALNPSCGWEIVDRLDVENREVFGTTGYIHILKGKNNMGFYH